MPLIDQLTARLQRHPKRVVFPEGSDPRIIQAARQFATRRLGAPILLGDRTEIKSHAERLDISLEGVRIIDPERSDDLDDFVTRFQGVKRFAGMKETECRTAVLDKNYFATLMLATGQADALVSGATVTASSALRPLFQLIKLQNRVKTASSMLLLDMDNGKFGINGVLFLADCGVIPHPTEEQLADIAVTTAGLAHHLTNEKPRVAMLSYSTKNKNAKDPSIARMKSATGLAHDKAREKGLHMEVEGELQLDAALDHYTAEQKGIADSSVAGKANVLVFPDLNSGNITAKAVQILAEARGYGQIITGLTKPAAEISRGASAHDILGTSIIVACQAVDHRYLYPEDES